MKNSQQAFIGIALVSSLSRNPEVTWLKIYNSAEKEKLTSKKMVGQHQLYTTPHNTDASYDINIPTRNRQGK